MMALRRVPEASGGSISGQMTGERLFIIWLEILRG
ncbi:hypothetical protein PSAL_003940 [Pseudooceanicola algae]|uniref:Uncharacterized protein n=1 Tax=Pseudooceanicola algae TaxID=1537215 RepID=A0A418SFF0_9RHOB|nr:hypothetical protein PSAL_003940 [Pseudooceanicola algae]